MAKKNDKIEVMGEVVKLLPNAMFQVKLEAGNIVSVNLSGKMRIRGIRILLGDSVSVELGEYDLSKGRIVYRHK